MSHTPPATRGDAHTQLPHRSLWRMRLAARAAEIPLDDWLIAQANTRGFYGAFLSTALALPADPELTLEDIIVGLCQPHAPADVRSLKLVVRILQSGQIEASRLWSLARRERADFVLHWLLTIVPEPERNEALERIARRSSPPRGYRTPDFRYDPTRLLRRPVRRSKTE